MNPDNKRCATCTHSSSFVSASGWYEAEAAGHGCPQRLVYEDRRIFPCPAYVRCISIVGIEYDISNFPEIELRYYRSFSLPERTPRRFGA